MTVYLDNAASTPLHPEVFESMKDYLTSDFGNPSSIHSHGRKLRNAIELSRKSIADLLGCSPGNIIFTSGGTEADNFAIKCMAYGGQVKKIITSPLEHHAVLHTVEWAKNQLGTEVYFLSPDEKGNISHEELEKVLKESDSGTTLVSLMHGNNEIGTLTDIKNISNLCKEYGAYFHTDTVQSIGHTEINVNDLPVDFLVASAHKFYGPKGVGFLYKSSDITIVPFICGGGQERKMRAGTENVPAIVGMAKAFELAHENKEKYHEKIWGIKSYLKDHLTQNFPNITFNGEVEEHNSLPTVLNVAFPTNSHDGMLLMLLDVHGISASGGSACTSGSVNASHVLKGINCTEDRMANSIRFSFSIFNTKEEIDYTVKKIKEIFQL